MSKYHLYCSCIYCGTETTVQSIKSHIQKHHTNQCKQCGCDIPANKKFCSSSCAASFNNYRRPKREIKPKLSRQEKENIRFINGEIAERVSLRKHIARTQGYNCQICNISKWNGKDITLRVDHIDGNAGNNSPSNLRLLCPNCDSQTPTFSGRNKGSGRKCRGLPLR